MSYPHTIQDIVHSLCTRTLWFNKKCVYTSRKQIGTLKEVVLVGLDASWSLDKIFNLVHETEV